jgi:hypothetical protein
MFKEIVDKLRLEQGDSLDFEDDFLLLRDSVPEKLTEKNFYRIQPIFSRKKVAFIDGGQATVFSDIDRSLHFIRTFCHIDENYKTVFSKKYEAFLYIEAVEHNKKILYQARPIYKDSIEMPDTLSFDSMDLRIMEGAERAGINSVSGVFRRIFEINSATNIIKELNEGDMIILDGTLETKFAEEKKGLEKLFELGEKNNVLIAAVAKTINLFTNRGKSIINLLKAKSPKHAWYYYPIADINNDYHRASLYFAKLHPKSRHILRFELNKNQNEIVDTARLFGHIACLSKDLILPGYPYGLIKADRFARVGKRENEYMRTKFLAILPELDKKDVHEILDNIS